MRAVNNFWALYAGACLVSLSAGPAMADGEYLQFEYARGSSTAVASVVRGPYGAAAGWSEYDSGSALGANATYRWLTPALGSGALVRIGPSVRIDQDTHTDLGAKIAFERWSATPWGSVFLLADYNTIQDEYLLLGELAHARSGLSASLAVQGGESFSDNTFVLAYRIKQSPLRFRVGYRFEAQQMLVGFAVNTF
ncbi:MAG: hypothetical protein JJU18_08580 [Oceanicaulis sp.]|nr:hypothetical protein [Oceanicaulis sp.]